MQFSRKMNQHFKFWQKQILRKNIVLVNKLFSSIRNIEKLAENLNSHFKPVQEKVSIEVRKNIEHKWKNKISYPLCVSNEVERNEKFYLLSMFPYPSGDLHLGHVRVYTVGDALARFHSMNGKQVIHPMGWDAFGLPAENAAKDRNQQPEIWTRKNIANMKEQVQQLGITYDWNREFATCDPSYYKWTQYLFLKMFDKGMAYRQKALVNWDPLDQTVLADEQIDENGLSWRSGAKVEKRYLRQWFLRTTAFSKSLYDNLDCLDSIHWSRLKKIQRNWIGECKGFIFDFAVTFKGKKLNDFLTVWTERPELLYGVSYITVSSEHHLNSKEYIDKSAKTSSEYQLLINAIHPFTGESLPVFVSNKSEYPLAGNCQIGIPGEVMEDQLFADQFTLKKIKVVDITSGTLINSGEFTGMDLEHARKKICQTAQEKGIGGYQSSAKLRDWLISRQRYWGTPIPIIHCSTCNIVPVPYDDLPVTLPFLETLQTNISPLAAVEDWINVECPKCGKPAKRETDTMDTFVDSAWYFLRFLDPQNNKEPFNSEVVNSLLPIDLYIGGIEHADVHLYYARFFSHFLHSLGLLKEKEPFHRVLCQGYVKGKTYFVKETGKYLKPDEIDIADSVVREKATGKLVQVEWEKMSKSKFNGVSPNDVIEHHSVDTTRLCMLSFVAPETNRKWDDKGLRDALSWQRKLWLTLETFEKIKNNTNPKELPENEWKKWENVLYKNRNDCIKKVTFHFNTTCQISVGISKLQELTSVLRIKCIIPDEDETE
ncbi:probable leucine--tRNA ligase, mitochondrial isoform X1 [Centruroides sculpturatus]|uniref:probable leucine--tRNA ligase, mitochondrial isoform X1 n=1 Tax=Centruroides sculpturatus TaxID=218467 RepID=UPI000C6EB1DD|nr:probable leucine--tRNA ligase, mitochondrial isoform X1 [Centruroides sculpturatus]